ncbi:MAG: hypothetical protein ABII19_01240 [Patescibacteria group bacterium]
MKILGWLLAPFLWFARSFVSLIRGRVIDDSSIAEEKEVVNTTPPLPQSLPVAEAMDQSPRPWIARVNGLVLYTKGGARELCFATTSQPSAKQLRDVRIWVFPERHPAGIEFTVVAGAATKRKNHPFWPLVPSTEWYEKASETRLPKSLFPTDVSRIELCEDEDSYPFLVSTSRECFYPANNERMRKVV